MAARASPCPLWACYAIFLLCTGGLPSGQAQLPATSTLLGTQGTSVTTIYKDGLATGWRDASYGVNSEFADKAAPRQNALSCITANVTAWSAIVLEAPKPFAATQSLNFWMRGSGATSFALYLEDSVNRRFSRDVRLTTGSQIDASVVYVQGNDADGWVQVAVMLSKLVDAADAKSLLTPSTFNRIVFRDVSGAGFYLQLDDMKLVSAPTMAAFQSASVSNQLTLPQISLPVFGTDLAKNAVSPMRFIMRLKPGISSNSVASICGELVGQLPAGASQRFAGFCDNSTFSWVNLGAGGLTTSVDWRFLSFSVANTASLTAMRAALGGQAEYIEQDFKAHANPNMRGLEFATGSPAPASSPSAARPPTAPANASAAGNASNATGPAPASVLPPADATALDGNHSATDNQTATILPVPGEGGDVQASEDYATIQVSVASWGLDRLDQLSLPLDGVYSPGNLDGRGVHVFVLDTGIRSSHLAFRGKLGASVDMTGSSSGTADLVGHGTHVSGTACGSVYGVAPSCVLHMVKVLGDDGSGSYTNIINGMRWVKNYKANNNIASAVVSMSLGGPRSASLNDAVSDLTAAGVTVVVAAGNDNRGDACTKSPSSSPDAIVVGATTSSDALSSFSNIGSCVGIFAPGSAIVSASKDLDSGAATMSGTSMATPHVAGVVAMILQAKPGASPAAVRKALLAAAVRQSLDPSSKPYLLDALASRLRGTSSPTPAPAPPPASAPAPTNSVTTFPPIGSFGRGSMPTFCTTCPWCMFCR